jgi:Spy/CpxP family protein refolding chaperone
VNHLKLLILVGFLLTFMAGLTVGRLHPFVAAKSTENRPWLSQQLNLSTEQQRQMKQIWSDAALFPPDIPRKFHEVDHQRDEAVRALMSDPQRARIEQITREHDAKIASLQAERDRANREAEDRSRQILTDEQRKKFDEILKAHGHRRGNPMMRFRGRPSTVPAAKPDNKMT